MKKYVIQDKLKPWDTTWVTSGVHASEGAAVWGSVPEECMASHCGRTDGKYKHA